MKLHIFKRILMVIVLIFLMIVTYKGYEALKLKKAINIKKALEIQDLKEEIDSVEKKTTELDKFSKREVVNSDYEEMARNELGLIKKDEIVIKPR